MATMKDDGNLSHSVLNAADEYFDLYCTPCNKGNFSKEAVKYCPICKEYFCVDCVYIHKSFKVLSKHVLVDPTVTQTSTSRSGGQILCMPTELCKRHPHEVINMYCGDGDKVGCSVCFTQDHRFCDDVKYIPEYIQTIDPTEQVHQINKDLIKATKVMNKLKTKHDRMEDDLDESKTTCKQEIQNYRAEVNHIIDKIEKATLAELDAKHRDTKQITDITNKAIHDVHDEMIRFRSEIESDQSNDAQKFVIAKLSQSLITQGRELESELSSYQTTKLTFARNSELIHFLLSTCTFGILSPPATQDSTLHRASATSNEQPQQSTSQSAVTASRQQPQQSTSPLAATTSSQHTQRSTGPSAVSTSSQHPQRSTSPSAATTSSQQPQQSTSPSAATTSSQQPQQSTRSSAATTSSQQPQQSTSPSAATTSGQQPQQSTSQPAATTNRQQQQQSTSPSAATTSRQQSQQTQSTSPSAATTSSQQPQQSTSPSAATTSSQQPQQSTGPSAATTSGQQQQQSTSPSAATTSSQHPQQSTSPSAATTSPQQPQQSTSPSATTTSTQELKQTRYTSHPAASNTRDNIKASTRQQHDIKVCRKALKQGLYKIVDKVQYNIKQPDNEKTCTIWSSCIIDDGNIMLADSANDKLKLVDSRTYTIISSLKLNASPWSVCRVGRTEAAVCLYNDTVQFVSTRDDRLESVRSLSMPHKCRGIAVLKDKMYIGAWDSVRIYTLTGKHVNTIEKKSSIFSLFSNRDNIFSGISDITVSDDESMIHIADCYKGVITLDTTGSVVRRYSGSELDGAIRVCTDGTGNVFVSGLLSRNVIQLAPDGTYMGEIATRRDGGYWPRSLCYDSNNHRLVVGHGYDNNIITVYTVQ